MSPESVLDQDPTTAWSPSPGDRHPSISVTFQDPIAVSGIQLVTGRGWAAESGVFVEVSTDSTQEVGALRASGQLDVTASRVRRLTLTFLPGADPLALASLELREIILGGASLPAPPATLTSSCGSGPVLRVDGVEIPTSVSGPRSAIWGVGAMTWRACRAVTPGSGQTHRIDLGPIEGWRPGSVVLRGSDGLDDPNGSVPVPVEHLSPTALEAAIDPGPARLFALTQNTNPGWRATVQGMPLQPVVVDGFRQGFVIPAGVSGRITVDFAPDQLYRVALVGGAIVGMVVLAMAFVVPPQPARRTSPRPLPVSDRPAPVIPTPVLPSRRAVGLWGRLVAAGILGALLAGPWAAALSVVIVAATWRIIARWRTWRPVVVAALVGLAGLVSAAVLVAGGGRWRGVEDLLVALAVVVGFTPAPGAPRPSRVVPRDDASATPASG